MASVTLPSHMQSGRKGSAYFLFFNKEEGTSLSKDDTTCVEDNIHKALGGLFIEEGLPLDSEEVHSFNAAVNEAFLLEYGPLPSGVSLKMEATGYHDGANHLTAQLVWDEGPWSLKDYRSVCRSGEKAFKALRFICGGIDTSTGRPTPPPTLVLREGVVLDGDGSTRKKDTRLTYQQIKYKREVLLHNLLHSFTFSNNNHSVAEDASRPVAESKALIDALHKVNPEKLRSLYVYRDTGSAIKALSHVDADKILKKADHKQARKDLLEILLYMRKKVPVSKRTRQVQEDDE